ncbi:hypothetical protein [Halovivax gelatinilyticus]|uniref:hypothetical protein n=1 Tax=Halovivax gelatinilyticus TaxID=2961597 RepID=UPI0020CA8163|nr:hypothetical protein [Halovivax gelatinilyticus]
MSREDGDSADDELGSPDVEFSAERARKRRTNHGLLPLDGLANMLPSSSVDEADPPWWVEFGGNLGVKLGVVSLALAIVGVTAAWLEMQPLGNLTIVLSLVSITVAMLLGFIYQIFILQW